jgi:hypothetical protein
VEVTSSADTQSILLSQSPHPAFVGGRVGGVDGFQAHQAGFLQFCCQLLQPDVADGIEHGVSQNGYASGFKNQLHGLNGSYLFPGNKAGSVIAYISVKGLFHAFNIAVI